jgi:hypothetical protein
VAERPLRHRAVALRQSQQRHVAARACHPTDQRAYRGEFSSAMLDFAARLPRIAAPRRLTDLWVRVVRRDCASVAWAMSSRCSAVSSPWRRPA